MKLLRKGTALLLSVAMVVGLVAGGLLIHTVADTAIQWYDADLDDLIFDKDSGQPSQR